MTYEIQSGSPKVEVNYESFQNQCKKGVSWLVGRGNESSKESAEPCAKTCAKTVSKVAGPVLETRGIPSAATEKAIEGYVGHTVQQYKPSIDECIDAGCKKTETGLHYLVDYLAAGTFFVYDYSIGWFTS